MITNETPQKHKLITRADWGSRNRQETQGKSLVWSIHGDLSLPNLGILNTAHRIARLNPDLGIALDSW